MADAIERLLSIQVSGDLAIQQVGGTIAIEDQRPKDFVIEITAAHGSGGGSGSCTGEYSWREVLEVGCTQEVALRSGSPGNVPAREIDGNLNVSVGTHHRAWFSHDQQRVEFKSCCTGGGSGTNYVDVVVNVCLISGSGSGS